MPTIFIGLFSLKVWRPAVGVTFNSATVTDETKLQSVAFLMDDIDTYPSTMARITEFPYMMLYSPVQSKTPSSFSVPRKDLLRLTANKWYKTVAGADSDVWDEIQGEFTFQDNFGGGSTSTITFMVQYICEFCDPVPISSTPEAMAAAALEAHNQLVRYRVYLKQRGQLKALTAVPAIHVLSELEKAEVEQTTSVEEKYSTPGSVPSSPSALMELAAQADITPPLSSPIKAGWFG